MHRLASLDYLRGVAALAVALPHFVMLGSKDWPTAQVISILAVEQFFVLSGFVLAPQMLHCLRAASNFDIWVFLVRRWMRTVPPYLFALLLVALITANLYSPVLGKYALYIQNFFRPLPDAQDFFPVAWSLSVEEWFYVVFALFLLLARLARLDVRGFVVITVAFVACIAIARIALGDMANWDAAVRRVVVFRMDSIALGVLLYCAMNGLRSGLVRAPGAALALGVCLSGAVAFVAGWEATVSQSRLWQHLYPFASGLFAVLTIHALVAHSAIWQGRAAVAQTGFFLGKISYTIYLFHLPIILVLRPHLAHWPLLAQLAIYTLALTLFSAAFYFSFEGPILRARPSYPRLGATMAGSRSRFARLGGAFGTAFGEVSLKHWLLAGVSLLALALAAVAVERFQQKNQATAFYVALIFASLALASLLHFSGLWRLAAMRGAAAAAISFCVLLPIADWIVETSRRRSESAPVEPVYSFREATGNQAAFLEWWVRYSLAWQRSAAAIQARDPERRLPFVLIPHARSSFFGAPIEINNFGFRGADIEKDKGERYRIFVLGESPTFGTMIGAQDRNWVEALQLLVRTRLSCEREIEIINAGVAAYNIQHNTERLRRDILPLGPDMIVSYHGYNSYGLIDSDLERMPAIPALRRRGSLLISELRYRLRLIAYNHKMRRLLTRPPSPYSDRHAKAYEEFVAVARQNGARVVLGTLSLAVNADSPSEVIDFYGRIFRPIERILPAIAEHNRIVEKVAKQSGVDFVDTRPGLDGQWDSDYFIDVVHFTHRGAAKLAENFYRGLEPLLTGTGGPGCGRN